MIRPIAELHTSFPDDAIEENGEPVRWPGFGLVQAIRTMLAGLGYEPDEARDLQE